MAKRGRPPDISKEKQDMVVDALRLGCYMKTAADYAGVEFTTVTRWIELGAKEDEGAYRKFYEATKKAIGDSQRNALDSIKRASDGVEVTKTKTVTKQLKDGTKITEKTVEKSKLIQWQAAAWILERRHPDDWGRRMRADLNADDEPMARPTVVGFKPPTGDHPEDIAKSNGNNGNGSNGSNGHKGNGHDDSNGSE